jgi:poly(hydroxyalkanoate) depolymerase family esterase
VHPRTGTLARVTVGSQALNPRRKSFARLLELARKAVALLARLRLRRAPPAPGRFAVSRKSSLHGFVSVSPAPPWRDYLLYLPQSAERTGARPALVVWIHGCRQDPEQFAAGTRIARIADEQGFLVLLPRQSRLANSERCWNWFDPRTAAGGGEAAIVAAQTEEVIEKFGVDRRHVYAAGLSSGGALAATLALRAPHLFSAVAVHSSVAAGAASDAAHAGRVMRDGPNGVTDSLAARARAAAPPALELPALIIHGSADDAVAPVNAVFLVRQFLLLNGLPLTELPQGAALPPAQLRSMQPRASGHLASDYYVRGRLAARLLTIAGLGHAWSGGDPAYPHCDARGVDATRLVCDFFASR